jgi:phenylalanyl-tRNA synthetase alpha chain
MVGGVAPHTPYFLLLPKGSEKSGFFILLRLGSILSLIIDTRTNGCGPYIITLVFFSYLNIIFGKCVEDYMGNELQTQIAAVLAAATGKISAASDTTALETVRVETLGKKGALTALLKQMGGLSAEERPVVGAAVNTARAEIETALAERVAALKAVELDAALKTETLDVTAPGKRVKRGVYHPMNAVLEELKSIFRGLGYTVAFGGIPSLTPEVETTDFVFDKLNTFDGHPAREPSDTFYIADDVVLRTQTSSVQIRAMLDYVRKYKEQNIDFDNLAVISPGRVYRRDPADATHSPVFHQCEGLVVGKGVTFANLKYALETFAHKLYGDDVKLRFRPHHFPYTEPSAEVDLSCFKCGGKGCKFCKGEGWIEMLGSGVVHPDVLENCGIDSRKYGGFAFGIGLERITMMRYEIDDLRLLFENNPAFLRQFG